MNETCTQENVKLNAGRDNHGRFIKGVSGNPKGARAYSEGLIEALEKESKRQGYVNFEEVVAKRALVSDMVLVAVLKKICPDKIEGKGFGNTITNITVNVKELSASNIRPELRTAFESV